MLTVDLAAYNERHELVLTVEVKNIRDVSGEWASQLRRNILAHGNYPIAKYFLVATPDKFFLWIGSSNHLHDTKPDYAVDMRNDLEPFFREFNVDPQNASGFIFEQIVARWLKGVMYPAYRSSDVNLPKWVTQSGLDNAVLQGDFYSEKAA